MVHRYPRSSSLVIGWVVAAGVAIGRIAYLDLTREPGVVATPTGLAWRYPPQALTSAVEWRQSTIYGGMVVGPATLLCLLVLRTTERQCPADVVNEDDG